MKKWLSLLLMSLVAIVLAACTASDDAGSENSTEDKPAENVESDSNTDGEKVLFLNNGNEPTSFYP